MTKSVSREIPVNEPLLTASDFEYVSECLKSGWISSAGRYIDAFESRWAEYCGRKHGVAVSNGTVALQLAVAALDIRSGDEIIIPAFTIISCALAVLYAGGVPVLVDSNPRTWGMDTDQLEARVTSRTRAIMPVHIYGHPVDMDAVMRVAEKYGLAVIEDAAEAHGAEYLAGRDSNAARWVRCGGMGTLSCFSFYANKLITTGEGGMVLTDDRDLADKARSLRNLCFEPGRRFHHRALGYNFRLTNLQAALAMAQIDRIEEIVRRKRQLGSEYARHLGGQPGIHLAVEEEWARNVYWMYGIVLDDDIAFDAAELGLRLKARGIETRPFFLGMHEQPALQGRGLFQDEHYPVTERIARRGLYLPSGLGLTNDQLVEVCGALREALSE